MQLVDRTVAILKVLADEEQDHALGVWEIAERAGLPQSTTHRILTALQKHGLVAQVPYTRKYILGAQLMFLGLKVKTTFSLREAARPVLHQLSAATGEDACLSVRDGDHGVLVERVEGTQPVRVANLMGRGVPLHVGAARKCLLAHLDPAAIDAYLKGPLQSFTPATVTDARQLRQELARIRAQGYAVTHGEFLTETAAVAAPVRTAGGRVVAALWVLAPQYRVTAARLPDLVRSVVRAAEQLSRQLGHGATPGDGAPPPRTAPRPPGV